MIGLFNINTHILDTSRYTNLLHDNIGLVSMDVWNVDGKGFCVFTVK